MTVTVDPTDGLGQAELLRRLEEVAERATRRFLGDADFGLERINQSENTTYRVTDRGGGKSILRIHRTGYHALAALASEHRWMEALREDDVVRTPAVLACADGTRIHHVITDELPAGRHCVFFEYLDGIEPDPDDLAGNFPNLGEVTARMHRHAASWTLPRGFERFTWNLETIFGPAPHWGHWYDNPSVDAPARAILARLVEALEVRLGAFGRGPERFGLVHSDLRLANLLIHEGETRVIDFDDCGFSWYLYDLATALSFIEDRPDLMELVGAWLEGYRRVRELSLVEEAEVPTFLMLRRVLIMAWIGSHAETELARDLAPAFTAGSCELAERYLSGRLLGA